MVSAFLRRPFQGSSICLTVSRTHLPGLEWTAVVADMSAGVYDAIRSLEQYAQEREFQPTILSCTLKQCNCTILVPSILVLEHELTLQTIVTTMDNVDSGVRVTYLASLVPRPRGRREDRLLSSHAAWERG